MEEYFELINVSSTNSRYYMLFDPNDEQKHSSFFNAETQSSAPLHKKYTFATVGRVFIARRLGKIVFNSLFQTGCIFL